jgi:hypothetical protein
MLRRSLRPALGCCIALAACATPGPVPPSLAELLTASPEQRPARLWLLGNRIVAAAVDLGPGALPAAVRTSLEAVAPRGEVLFQGREWGPRGTGFRIDKLYRLETATHTRSALIASDGTILERSHSVPIAETPQDVLAAAMQIGPKVEDAQIVSGREREEAWRCTVTDRLGHRFVVTIGLDGQLLGATRRITAQVEV